MPAAQYVEAKIVCEEETTDLETLNSAMFKTQKIKTPLLDEGASLDSHNADSAELSEVPAGEGSAARSKEAAQSVEAVYRERLQGHRKRLHKTLSFAD